MTTTASDERQRRWLVLLLAAALTFTTMVLLGATAGAGVASAATVSTPGGSSGSSVPASQTRVGVSPSDSILVVGGHETIGAGQRRDNLPSQSYVVSGCCVAAEDGADSAASDIGHAANHQFPGTLPNKSQFFDGEDLGNLSDTSGRVGYLQPNGNMRYVLHGAGDVGVDRATGLPTDVYTVIRRPDGSVVTMYPGTSPMG